MKNDRLPAYIYAQNLLDEKQEIKFSWPKLRNPNGTLTF